MNDRILARQQRTGGFDHLLLVCDDQTDERDTWDWSHRLLIDEVRTGCESSAILSSDNAATGVRA